MTNEEPVEIRRLHAADLPMMKEAGATVFDGPVIGPEAEAFFADDGHLLIGAIRDGRLIGFASGTILRHPDKRPALFINEIGVAEAMRRRGIGRRLLDAMRRSGHGLGAKAVWLATESENTEARALYEGAKPRVLEGVIAYFWEKPPE